MNHRQDIGVGAFIFSKKQASEKPRQWDRHMPAFCSILDIGLWPGLAYGVDECRKGDVRETEKV